MGESKYILKGTLICQQLFFKNPQNTVHSSFCGPPLPGSQWPTT
jgi:hypothetical protein